MFSRNKLESLTMFVVLSRVTVLIPSPHVKFPWKMPYYCFIVLLCFQYNTIFEFLELQLLFGIYFYVEKFTYFFGKR